MDEVKNTLEGLVSKSKAFRIAKLELFYMIKKNILFDSEEDKNSHINKFNELREIVLEIYESELKVIEDQEFLITNRISLFRNYQSLPIFTKPLEEFQIPQDLLLELRDLIRDLNNFFLNIFGENSNDVNNFFNTLKKNIRSSYQLVNEITYENRLGKSQNFKTYIDIEKSFSKKWKIKDLIERYKIIMIPLTEKIDSLQKLGMIDKIAFNIKEYITTQTKTFTHIIGILIVVPVTFLTTLDVMSEDYSSLKIAISASLIFIGGLVAIYTYFPKRSIKRIQELFGEEVIHKQCSLK